MKTIDDTLLIEGRHEDVRDRDNFTKMYFVRKYQLPLDVNPVDISSTIDSAVSSVFQRVRTHQANVPKRVRSYAGALKFGDNTQLSSEALTESIAFERLIECIASANVNDGFNQFKMRYSKFAVQGRLTVEARKQPRVQGRERMVPIEGPSRRGESNVMRSETTRSREDSGTICFDLRYFSSF